MSQKANAVIHRLAMVSLLLVAVMSIVGSLRQVPGAPAEMTLAPFFGIALWSGILWKIWKRPRQWGLGVGISLFLMIAFQSYLWWLSLNDPEIAKLDLDRSVIHFVLFYELPIFIAGTLCISLKFCKGATAVTNPPR
jgi:hypothetical protein